MNFKINKHVVRFLCYSASVAAMVLGGHYLYLFAPDWILPYIAVTGGFVLTVIAHAVDTEA